MAKRLALRVCDQLHHFIAAGVWDATPVETELLAQADRLVGGRDAVLVIDDTGIAYAFLQYRRLKTARREKKSQWAAASANFARRTPRHPRTLRSTTATAMPALSKMDLQRAAA
jgi:hypothetical protein